MSLIVPLLVDLDGLGLVPEGVAGAHDGEQLALEVCKPNASESGMHEGLARHELPGVEGEVHLVAGGL